MRPENLHSISASNICWLRGSRCRVLSSRAFAFYDPLGATGYRQNNLAEVIARYANADVERISAVTLA